MGNRGRRDSDGGRLGDAGARFVAKAMNRAEFKQLAQERIADAEALLTAGRFSAAYYLAGYAVECALKAVIARRTVVDDFPVRDAAKLYTHNLKDLLLYAGLGTARGAITTPGVSVQCSVYWEVVQVWNEQSRYATRTQEQAERLIEAINDPTDGVFVWLKMNW